MTTTRPTRNEAKFSIPSIAAIGTALLSLVVSAGWGVLLAGLAVVLGGIGVILSLSPRVRGGIVSIMAMIAGAAGVLIAIIRLVL